MKWVPYTGGEFAQCEEGYYFIYKKFSFQSGKEGWCAEYQPKAKRQPSQPIILSHADTLERARLVCEESHASVGRLQKRDNSDFWLW
jgi:hypothetical protein